MLILDDKLLPLFVNHGLLNILLASKLVIKKLKIILDLRHIRRNKLFGLELVNVKPCEEGVTHYFVRIALATESFRLFFVKKFHNEISCDRGHFKTHASFVRESYGALLDQKLHALRLPVEEGCDTDNELIKQDSHGPPVDCVVVTRTYEHLRGEVFRSSAQGIG